MSSSRMLGESEAKHKYKYERKLKFKTDTKFKRLGNDDINLLNPGN